MTWLNDPTGKAFLLAEYLANRRSTYDIARALGCHPNAVRRALVRHGIPPRTRSAAQAAALASGRHPHPTRGRARTPEERRAIGDGVHNAHKETHGGPADGDRGGGP